MHVVALVKHVPDVQSARSFTDAGLLARGGPDDTLNELDEDCLEAALRLVEAQPAPGAGEEPHAVTVLTVGPGAAVDALRRGLAMGASSAVHVSDDAIAGSDAIATARVIAAAVSHLDAQRRVDVVMAGMATMDGLTSLVPAAVAAVLGWPQLTLADRVDIGGDGGTISVRRVTGDDVEELRASLPAVVSVTDQGFRPRSPDVRGILAARRKRVESLGLADLGLPPEAVGLAGSTTRVLQVRPRLERPDRVRLVGDATVAQRLADHLASRGFR